MKNKLYQVLSLVLLGAVLLQPLAASPEHAVSIPQDMNMDLLNDSGDLDAKDIAIETVEDDAIEVVE